MESPIRVVVADDHPLVRAGLRLFVESDRDLTVVAEADSQESAVAAVLSHRPDVLLLDAQMPDGGGVELIKSVRRACAAVCILALTTFPDEVYAHALLRAGADACSSKCADCGELLLALKAAAAMTDKAGSVRTSTKRECCYATSELTGTPRHHKGRGNSGNLLTRRELDVLKLVGRGLNNHDIGLELGISSRTVQGYLTSAYHRMHVGSRTQAVTCAIKLGLINLENN